jgi:mono/diheme cytochrome c family protein
VLLALVFLPGCEDQYNESRIFPVRTDPVFQPGKLGDLAGREWTEPDPPGQLPLMRLKGMDDRRNPFYLRLDELPHESSASKAKREQELEKLRETLRGAFFDPTTLSTEQRTELQNLLNEVFGKPARPVFDAQLAEVSAAQLKTLRLDETTLKEGGQLYRLHCMQCHGLTGDGRGPTAQWVNPHPRDYRPGVFKFQSTNQADGPERRPRREDLFRTIYQGAEGTTMPAFNLLADHEVEALVSYVIFLSIRGQTELRALARLAKNEGDLRGYLLGKTKKGGQLRKIVGDWVEAQSDAQIIKPGEYKAPEDPEARKEWMTTSVQRGQILFQANCGTCHNDYGRQVPYKLDSAGWGILVRPADLTLGVYRGGRRPIDLYWRIHSGINGSGMAKLGQPAGPLSSDQIWDVVNFLQALPYPAMREAYGININ